MIYEVVLDSVKKQIALLTEAEEIIKKNGMDTYKKVESRSLEQQLMALYEEGLKGETVSGYGRRHCQQRRVP
mgnify:CR=1 FL=1